MGIDKTVYYYHCEKTSKLALLKMQSHNVGNYKKKNNISLDVLAVSHSPN